MTKTYTANPLKESEGEFIIERLNDDSIHEIRLKEAEDM